MFSVEDILSLSFQSAHSIPEPIKQIKECAEMTLVMVFKCAPPQDVP